MKVLTIKDFGTKCCKTLLPESDNRPYLVSGLRSEIGELDGVLKKRLRKDKKLQDDDVFRERVISECGDIYWYSVVILIRSKVSFDHDACIFEDIRKHEDFQPVTKEGFLSERLDELYSDLDMVGLNNGNLIKPLAVFSTVDNFIGDVGAVFNFSRRDVADKVLAKLAERKKLGTIHGDGEGSRAGTVVGNA